MRHKFLKKNKITKILMFSALILVLLAIIFCKHSKILEPVEIVRLANYEDSIITSAVVLRDESPFFFEDNEKVIKNLVKDGEMICSNQKIFNVFLNKNYLKSYEKALNLDNRIKKLNKVLNSRLDPYCDFEAFNNDIYDSISCISNDNFSTRELSELKNSIEYKLLLRNKAFANHDDITLQIKNLESQKKEIQKNFTFPENINNSKFNGYFSDFCDGYETICDAKPSNFTYDTFDFYKEENKSDFVDKRKIGKVVREPCYILCKINKNIVEKIKIGCNYEMIVEGLSKFCINCKAEKILPNPDNTEFIVVMLAENIPKYLLNLRKTDVRIIFNRYFGIKINKKSIHKEKTSEDNDSEDSFVFVKHLKNFTKKKVKIIAETDEFVICDYEETPEIDNTKIQNGDRVLIGS